MTANVKVRRDLAHTAGDLAFWRAFFTRPFSQDERFLVLSVVLTILAVFLVGRFLFQISNFWLELTGVVPIVVAMVRFTRRIRRQRGG